MTQALFAPLDFAAASFKVQRSGSSERTISLAAGQRTPEQLCAALEAAWQVHTELLTLTARINSSGQVVITPPTGATVTITWAGGLEVRDCLRYTGATTTCLAGSANTATRQASGAFYMALPVADDVATMESLGSQAESDTGAEVTSWGLQFRRALIVRIRGNQRDAVESERRAFRDFWADHLATGNTITWCPDVSVTTAYAEVSNPFGRHTLTPIDASSYAPEREQANYWGRWTHRLQFVEVQT